MLLDDQELAFTRKVGKPTETNTMTPWRIAPEDLERLQPAIKADELVEIFYLDCTRHISPSFRIKKARARKTKSRYYWTGKGRDTFPGRYTKHIDIHEVYVAESLAELVENVSKALKAQQEKLERDYKYEEQRLSDISVVLGEYEKGKREPEAYVELKPSRPGEIEV